MVVTAASSACSWTSPVPPQLASSKRAASPAAMGIGNRAVSSRVDRREKVIALGRNTPAGGRHPPPARYSVTRVREQGGLLLAEEEFRRSAGRTDVQCLTLF